MNIPPNIRLAAAAASMAIVFTLFSGVVSLAEQPAASPLLAQAAAAATVR